MTTSSSASPSLLPLVLVALLLASAGAGAGAYLVFGRAQSATSPVSAPDGASAELQERMARLEAELRRPVPVTAVEAVQRHEPDERRSDVPAGPELVRRVAALEQEVAALRGLITTARNAAAVLAAARTPDPVENAKRVASQQQVILDPGSDEKTKLRAWAQLRNLGDSWNDAVVATMTHLGLTSTDASVRADVWRQADGGSKVHPVMCNALLQALATDADANVRDEAAETLENHLAQPGVRQALELASRSDADEKVRRRALETLSRADRRR